MKSIEERIKHLPKVAANIDKQFIIELTKDGEVVGKVIGSVTKMTTGSENNISIDLCLLNNEAKRSVTRYEFSNPDVVEIEL